MIRATHQPRRSAPFCTQGKRAAAGLRWLEDVAGPKAVQKFLGGKIARSGFSGHDLIGVTDQNAGRELIAELLEMLRRGETIPLFDVASYYAHGKRWTLGMAIYNGKLVDVWTGTERPVSTNKP